MISLKKMTALLLAGLMTVSMTACGKKDVDDNSGDASNLSSSSEAAEPLTGLELAEIITAARSDEENEAYSIYTETDEDVARAKMILDGWGLAVEDFEAYAMSISLINIRAYGVALLRPTEGSKEAVEQAVNDFVAAQQASFENYLPDQKIIADGAIVETLSDGTILLVMCQDAQTVYDSIVSGLETAGQ